MKNPPWTKKYEPDSLDELQLQNNVIVRLKKYIQNFNKKDKPLLFYGPPGTGKTVSAHIIAKHFDYEIVEVNSSDFRNKNNLDRLVGNASKQMSLFHKSKLILIDEVDALGSGDRGALTEIIKLSKATSYPVIMTANDPWNRKLNKLRSACSLILFDKLDSKIISQVLKEICIKEGIEFQNDDIRLLAMRSGGDLRGAIIDLQTLIKDKKFDSASLMELSGRMQKQSVMNALALLFKTSRAEISSRSFSNVDIDVNTQYNWIEENVSYAYDTPKELNFAYNYLSYADIFNRRIRKKQHWRFLVHINALSTIGVSLAKTSPYNKFFTFKETNRFLKLWLAKNKNSARLNFSKVVAEKTHCSYKDIYKDIYLFKYILSSEYNKKLFLKEFDMSKSDIEFIFKK